MPFIQLLTVETPYFEAGLVVQDNLITKAQPPIQWAEGRSLVWLTAWLARRRGWSLREVSNNNEQPPGTIQ